MSKDNYASRLGVSLSVLGWVASLALVTNVSLASTSIENFETTSIPNYVVEDFTVSSYQALRSQSCSAGQTALVTGANIAGTFVCVSNQSRDDGGIYIDVAGDSDGWVRRIGSTYDDPSASNPVDLTWYVSGQPCSAVAPYAIDNSGTCEITNLLKETAARYKSERDLDSDGYLDLFLRMPSGISQVTSEFINFGTVANSGESTFGPTDSVYILQPAAGSIILKQLDSGVGDYNNQIFFQFGDYSVMVIGSELRLASRADYTLTFRGLHDTSPFGQSRGYDVTNSTPHAPSTFTVWLTESADRQQKLIWRANVVNSKGWGFWHGFRSGSRASATHVVAGVDTIYAAGNFIDSGFTVRHGSWKVLVPEDIYTSDPLGVSLGMCNGRSPCPTGNYDRYRIYGTEVRLFEANGTNKNGDYGKGQRITAGKVILQYGTASQAQLGVEWMGNSPSDRLVYSIRDRNRTGPTDWDQSPRHSSASPGTKNSAGIQSTGMKWDPMGDHGPGKKWLEFVHGPNQYGSWGGDDESFKFLGGQRGVAAFVSGFQNVRVSGAFTCAIEPSGPEDVAGGDHGYRVVLEGVGTAMTDDPNDDCSPYVRLTEGDTLRNGNWYDVHIANNQNYLRDDTWIQKGSDPHDTVVENVTVNSIKICTGEKEARCNQGGGSSAANVALPIGSVVSDDPPGPAAPGDIVIRNVELTKSSGVALQIGNNVTSVRLCQIKGVNGTTVTAGTGSNLLVWDGQAWVDRGNSFALNGQWSASCPGSSVDPPSSQTSQSVDLQSGWNTVSLYVRPEDTSVSSVISVVEPNLVIMKDADGNIYYPELSIDSIVNWSELDAYQINMSSTASLDVGGEDLTANQPPIQLQQGWNLVPYLESSTRSIDDAFSSILNELVMIKDNDGQIYYPELGINSLEHAVPGQGFWVYMQQQSTLTF